MITIRPIKIEKVEPRYLGKSYDPKQYALGWGAIGHKKTMQVRRFLRVRSSNGICRYVFWSHPRKGEVLPRVYTFKHRLRLDEKTVEERLGYVSDYCFKPTAFES